MKTLTAARLRLRPLDTQDAEFILRLLTDPDWLKYIGDRGVNNIDDAVQYIQQGPQCMYQNHGMGLLLVERTDDTAPLGLCGILVRSDFALPDLGFAFLPEYRGLGYAYESAQRVLLDVFEHTRLEKIAAMTSLDNPKSIYLLEKLGFIYQKVIYVDADDPGSKLFELAKSRFEDSLSATM